MGKYHEAGRFSEDLSPDMESALYHLKKAARGGVTDALYTLAHIHLQQPHDDFKEIGMEVSVDVHVRKNSLSYFSLPLPLSLSLSLSLSFSPLPPSSQALPMSVLVWTTCCKLQREG